ncbi:MAG: Nif3-like dinuclear metal center hexameric protein [Fimbriimonas sp.]
MVPLREILRALEEIAPARLAFEWDRIGLQVGDPDAQIEHAIVSLDRSQAAVQYAVEQEAQLLLAHHPLIFSPLNKVLTSDHVGATITRLIRHQIAFVAAHTNWDAADGGINDALADRLGLFDCEKFGSASVVPSWTFVGFVPPSHLEEVLRALEGAGCGRIGAYTGCAYLGQGIGRFEPTPDAKPYTGSIGHRSEVPEVRFEVRLPDGHAERAVAAYRRAHPYESPAFDVIRRGDEPPQPGGRIGQLHSPMALRDFVTFVDDRLQSPSLAWGDPARLVRRVAVVGGAADGEWIHALRAGADVFVTGEVKQHVALEASESGLAILSSGHYATEQPGMANLRDRLSEAFPDVEWELFEPAEGSAGRPCW